MADISFSVYPSKYAAAPLFTKTIGDGVTVVNDTEGEIAVSFTAAELNLPPGLYYYDVLVDDDNEQYRQPRGKFTICSSGI